MNLALAQHNISVLEYLDSEPQSNIRHQYLAGQVYAMAGASEKHNRIVGNLFFTFAPPPEAPPVASMSAT